MSKYIDHARLDRRLDSLARRPERFVRDAARLAAALDAREIDLEISDPHEWRGSESARNGARVSVENQLRSEVDRVKTLGREDEMRLARRIEFARIRMERTLEQHGLTTSDLARVPALPSVVTRRRMEWHALRLEMVERNLYLVLINVERFTHTTAERADLIQGGAAALFRAVDGFDWRRGLLFRTYAVYWLNQAFRSYLYNFNSTVRVPVYLQKALKHINAAIERLGDPDASADEIARVSGLRRHLVASARASVRRTRSLDAPLGNHDDSASLADELALQDDDGPYSITIEDVSLEASVQEALAKLSERERRVVQMRFGIGYGGKEHTFSEVAETLGVSLERVRQILVHAVTKMRTPRLRRLVEPLLT